MFKLWIISALLVFRVSYAVTNELDCSGLVIGWEEESSVFEFAYVAGVCWSRRQDGEGESFKLQCDSQGKIVVNEYADLVCDDSEVDTWEPPQVIDCEDANNDFGDSCEAYCPSGGFDEGCDHFIVRVYWNVEGCGANNAPLNEAWLDYSSYPFVDGYCYSLGGDASDFFLLNGFFKFGKNSDDEVVQTFYTDQTCTTETAYINEFGVDEERKCTRSSYGNFTGITATIVYVNSGVSGDLTAPDLTISGQACVATGDPHFTTFNGLHHHFQGTNDEQYYYIAPCFGSSDEQLPFRVLATHFQWPGSTTVMGVSDLTLELYESSTMQYYLLFLKPGRNPGYILGKTLGTKYAQNYLDLAYTEITNGEAIGNRFTFAQDDDRYTITVVGGTDDGCTLKVKFEGATVTILPPDCEAYKEHICGLCGEFTKTPGTMRTCDNSAIVVTQADSSRQFWEDPMAYDVGGMGWSIAKFVGAYPECGPGARRRRLQFGGGGAYEATIPENFTMSNPCEVSVESVAISECETARAAASECCEILGETFCDQLQSDCAFDACVGAEGVPSAVAAEVTDVFTNAINSVCTIPGIEEVFDPENLNPVATTTTTTTDSPSEETESEDGVRVLDAFVVVYSMMAAFLYL